MRLLELGTRPVTLLDGDIVRKNLSSELGFSKEHRDLNVQRIGFVAAEITKNGGIAICAPIAPYKGSRDIVRENVSAGGVFVEIHVSNPIETCEGRDRKGLYALPEQARSRNSPASAIPTYPRIPTCASTPRPSRRTRRSSRSCSSWSRWA